MILTASTAALRRTAAARTRLAPRQFVRHGGAVSCVPSSSGPVFKYEDHSATSPGQGQVSLRVLAAPINVDEVMRLGGKKGFAGSEGVAEVTAVGAGVSGIAAKDRVVPMSSCKGFWRSEMTVPASEIMAVPSTLPVETAAILGQTLPLAFALAQKLTNLPAGAVMVQNDASSAVGLLLVQMAAAMGIRSVNIVKPLPDHEDSKTKELIKMLGGTVAVDSVFLSDDDAATRLLGEGKVVVGFDAVGGAEAEAVAKLIGIGGTLVSYNCKEPDLTLDCGSLANGLINIHPFSMENFIKTIGDKAKFYSAVAQAAEVLDLRVPFDEYDLKSQEKVDAALEASKNPFQTRGVMFRMGWPEGEEPDEVVIAPAILETLQTHAKYVEDDAFESIRLRARAGEFQTEEQLLKEMEKFASDEARVPTLEAVEEK